MTDTDDLRIADMTVLPSPDTMIAARPASDTAIETVKAGRRAIQSILRGSDDRLLVVVGPCSIHDPESALDYARRLAPIREELDDTLEIAMRVYFEKPRTVGGWKGLINDPDLDDSFRGPPLEYHIGGRVGYPQRAAGWRDRCR